MLTLAEGQGIQGLGLGSLREHPGVTPAHHYSPVPVLDPSGLELVLIF